MAKNIKGSKRDADLHKLHRSRMRESFRTSGFNGFHEHNILEMLLFYSIPRIDTNEIAHRLLNNFGSLHGVFDADIEQLVTVPGIGIEAATLIKFFPAVFKAYELSKSRDKCSILDSQTAVEYLSGYFKTATSEILVALFLDAQGVPINQFEYTQYKIDEVDIDLSNLTRLALLNRAKGVILAHNHVTGFANPSNNDIEFTEMLAKQLKTVDITLCEHLIFANNDICCLSKNKRMKKGILIF